MGLFWQTPNFDVYDNHKIYIWKQQRWGKDETNTDEMCMGVVTTMDIRDASNYDKAISYFLYVVLIAIAAELKCICGYYCCGSNGLYIRDVSK